MDIDMDVKYDFDKAGIRGSVGTSMLEVFSVLLNQKIEVKKKIQVFGTITVTDSKGTLDLYNQELIDIDSLKAYDPILSLIEPCRVIPARGIVTFSVNLTDKYGNEFVKGSFTLDFMDESSLGLLDKYLMDPIDGVRGSAQIYYTIPTTALGGNIKIQLIKKDDYDGSGHSDVNGRIFAHYGNDYDCLVDEVEDVKKQYYKYILFEKTPEDNPLQLRHNDYLPLSRSFVITAAQSSIVIVVNAKIHHSNGQSDQLEGRKVQIPTRIRAENEHVIELNHCTLKFLTYFKSESYLS